MFTAELQTGLFAAPQVFPAGFVYQPDFLTREEEAELLAQFRELPFAEAHFQKYVARRRVVRYGEGGYAACYGDEVERRNPRPIPEFLLPLRHKVAGWRGVPESDFVHALVTEYQPGTPIGWHSDAPHFEIVVGISLAGRARMRFRPCAANADRNAAVALDLAPRSAYVMQNEVRWKWQHHIPPTKELRYSVTFRTLVREKR